MLRGLVMMFLVRTGLLRVVGGLMLDKRVPIKAKLIVPAAIIYLISPFDLIPDFIPFSGWIDDILVLVTSVALFLGTVPKDVILEHLGRGPRRPPDGGQKPGSNVVEGKYRILDDDEQAKS